VLAQVKSGSLDGDKAKAWQKKLADETTVKEMRTKAEGGDADAMWQLGACYDFGTHGLARDKVQARLWYERSVAARNPHGLAAFGEYLLLGVGGPTNTALGLINVMEAATLGSNFGAYLLGRALFKGQYGLPQDFARARFWLEKVVNGTCTHKLVMERCVKLAALHLQMLNDPDPLTSLCEAAEDFHVWARVPLIYRGAPPSSRNPRTRHHPGD
jgi:TPR repeat protein